VGDGSVGAVVAALKELFEDTSQKVLLPALLLLLLLLLPVLLLLLLLLMLLLVLLLVLTPSLESLPGAGQLDHVDGRSLRGLGRAPLPAQGGGAHHARGRRGGRRRRRRRRVPAEVRGAGGQRRLPPR